MPQKEELYKFLLCEWISAVEVNVAIVLNE